MELQTGSCACGAIEFTLNKKIRNIVNCHCNMCRRHNGSAFSTYAALAFSALEITKGEELLAKYAAGTGLKHFCKHCGTPLYNTNEKYAGACMIYFGSLHPSSEIRPQVNVWCENQLTWVSNVAEIPSLPQGIK